jgi:hypothetical protein
MQNPQPSQRQSIKLLSKEDLAKQILSRSRENNFYIFVGAGVSRIIGSPSWEELAQQYLNHLWKNKYIDYTHYEGLKKEIPIKLMSICQLIERGKKNKQKFDFRKSLMKTRSKIQKNKDTAPYSEIYQKLYQLPATFITTNYDTYLDAEVNQSINPVSSKDEYNQPKNKIIGHYEDLTPNVSLKNGDIVHIHGSINEEKLLLTRRDYLEAYAKNDSLLIKFFKETLSHGSFLFIGYGLEEANILEQIYKNLEGNESNYNHWIFYAKKKGKYENDLFKFQQQYFNSIGINAIGYDISKNGYGQLFEEINDLLALVNTFRSEKYFKYLNFIDKQLDED